MTTRTLFFAFIFISFAVYSQDWIEFTASETTKPDYELLQSTDTIVEFEIDVPGVFSTVIDTFNRVQIKEHTIMDSVGYPEMPIISYLVAIPTCDSVKLNIELLDSIKYTNFNIYPAPELVPDTTAGGAIALIEQFAYNRTAYETDAWFPGTVAEAVDKGAIRAQDVVRVLFYPVKFNPVKKEIWAYSKAKFTLTFYNSSGSIQKNVGFFNEVVGNTLINYISNGLNASVSCGAGLLDTGNVYRDSLLIDQKISYNCDYLIITPDDFFYNDDLWSLVNHRANFNGFDVVITRLSSIYNLMPDSLSQLDRIRDLIKNTYNDNNANHTYDGKLAYVNLFGDVELQNGSPGVPTYSEGYDVYFTQLTCDTIITGNDTIIEYDDYPDLMIGRCSVDDTEQVQNVVHKILNFKPEDLDYKHDMLTIASSNDFYMTQSKVLMAMDETIPDYYDKELMLDPGFNQPYPAWDSIPYGIGPLLSSWAEGKMFMNYMDHGYQGGWGNPSFGYIDIDSSKYDGVLPFVLSTACLTGAFHNNDNCMAEQFLCEDSIRGSIGFFGSSIGNYASTFNYASLFYNSLFWNYSSVVGEAIMESKLRIPGYSQVHGLSDYNLFSDPALNIFYENIDLLYPDLVAKANEIYFSPDILCIGDTIHITAIVKNITMLDANETFYVSCKAVELDNNDTIWIGNKLVDGLNGYCKDSLKFTWIHPDAISSKYKFIIEVDTSNMVLELNESNNKSFIDKKLYSYQSGFSVGNGFIINSHPVSYDIFHQYSGEEIVFGEKVVSNMGEGIISDSILTKGLTCIGNLSNNNDYNIVKVNIDAFPYKVISISENSTWAYTLSDYYVNHIGPFITDLDGNGLEEVVLVEYIRNNHHEFKSVIICIGHDGKLRWEYSLPGYGYRFNCPVFVNRGSNQTTIVLTDNSGNIYFLEENSNQNGLLLVDSLQIQGFHGQIGYPVASDLYKGAEPEMLFLCMVSQNGQLVNKLYKINLTNNSLISIDLTLGTYNRPLVSDLNNDGIDEIILGKSFSGIYIFDNNLDLINFIQEPGLNIAASELVIGDFNNDGHNDIVCQVKEGPFYDFDYILKIFDYLGNELNNLQIYGNARKLWVSDFNKDGSIDILHSSKLSSKTNIYIVRANA